MNEDRLELLCNWLKKQQKKIRPIFSGQDTECYRIYNHNIGDIPLYIDRYKDYTYITILEEPKKESMELSEAELKKITGAIYGNIEKVVVKSRQKLSEHQQHKALNPDDESQSIRFLAKENGINFNVNLSDYIDTGLFLDHRQTREMVRAEAFGKRVLNLFSYTGSFSVYAASGGAESITTVDLSASYLKWARENFEANQFLPDMFEFVQQDVFQFLEQTSGQKWDIIILDPPTFSNSRKMEQVLDIQRDHQQLIEGCAKLLAKGGKILFSTNYQGFEIKQRELARRFKVQEITNQTKGVDFGGKAAHRCWQIEMGHDMKSPQGRGQGRSSGNRHSSGRGYRSSSNNSPSRGGYKKR